MSRRGHFHSVLQAEPLAIRQTLLALRDFFNSNCDAATVDRLELVMAEVLNNIAEHSHSATPHARPRRKIRIDVRCRSGGMCCVVMDNGARIPDACFLPRCLPPVSDALPDGGFGLCLVRALAGKVRYARLAGRNLLLLFVPGETSLAA